MSVCFVSAEAAGLTEEGEVVGGGSGTEGGDGADSHAVLTHFWEKVMDDIRKAGHEEYKTQVLPLARVKKIMKLDEDVKMISAEAPLLFAKAAEIFIHELTLRAWAHTEDNKRRTLQRNDIAMAIIKSDQFDFLIDIVPRQEVKTHSKGREESASGGGGGTGGGGTAAGPEQVHYYFQLAQHQAALQAPQLLQAGGDHSGALPLPLQLSPAQMGMLRMQVQGSGQPLIIQAAPQQQLIQVQQPSSQPVYLAQVAPQDTD